MADPLDPNISDFEAAEIWRALPNDDGPGSKGERIFMAARTGAVESLKHNNRMTKAEKRIGRLELVYAGIIAAGPLVFFILGKIW